MPYGIFSRKQPAFELSFRELSLRLTYGVHG